MSRFRCKKCGGTIKGDEELLYGECSLCGSIITSPDVMSSHREQLYSLAENAYHSQEYEKALEQYNTIIAEYPNDAEAYWGALLSKYKIKYLKNETSTVYKPIFETLTIDCESLQSDSLFASAIANAPDDFAKKIYTEAMSDFLSSLNIERNTIPVINNTPKLKIQLKRPDLQETAVQASSSPNSPSSQLPPVTPHKLQLAQQSPSTNMDSDIPSSTVTGEQSQQNELRKEKTKLKLKRQEEEPQPNEGNIQSIPPSSTPQLTKSLTQSKYTTNEKSFSSPLWGFAKKLLFLCMVLFIAVYAWNKITKKMNQSYAEKSEIYQKYTALYPRKPYSDSNDEILKELTPKLIEVYEKLQIDLEQSKTNQWHFSNKPEEESLFEPFCDIAFQYASAAPHNNPIHGVCWGLCMLLDFNPEDYQKSWGKTRRYGYRPDVDRSIGENYPLQMNGEIITAFGLINSGMKVLSSSEEPPKSDHAIMGVSDLIKAFPPGARVKCIMPGGFADNAGLRVDDIITQIGDKSIDSGSSFYKVANTLKIGDTVVFHYLRGNDKTDRTFTIYFSD